LKFVQNKKTDQNNFIFISQCPDLSLLAHPKRLELSQLKQQQMKIPATETAAALAKPLLPEGAGADASLSPKLPKLSKPPKFP
jgi:hypothetical protein